MAATAAAKASAPPRSSTAPASLRRGGWLLVALIAGGAALRFSTLGLQSLWYDEAFGPVHLFNGSFGHLLSELPRTENTPPLWYVLEWVVVQALGRGAVALRLLSAVAGTALIPVAWLFGEELGGRRAAAICAALIAASPLFFWYSQEARAYSLYTLAVGLCFYLFLRAERLPTASRANAFGVAGALALLTHYFAAFLVVPMALYLNRSRDRRRACYPALLWVFGCGVALLPLAVAQGGRGAEWIASMSLAGRLEAIPQYYLTGYSGAPLGHGIELAVALPALAGLALGLPRLGEAVAPAGPGWRPFGLALGIAACGALIPLALVGFGQDFFDPRNVIGALVVGSGALAVALAAVRPRWLGDGLAVAAVGALLAVSVAIDFDHRLQRGDWSGLATLIANQRARLGLDREPLLITTVHLGSAPLRYYLPGAAPPQATPRTRALAEVGYAPLRSNSQAPPLAGFLLRYRGSVHGLDLLLFVAARPQPVAQAALIAKPLTPQAGKPQLLVVPPDDLPSNSGQ